MCGNLGPRSSSRGQECTPFRCRIKSTKEAPITTKSTDIKTDTDNDWGTDTDWSPLCRSSSYLHWSWAFVCLYVCTYIEWNKMEQDEMNYGALYARTYVCVRTLYQLSRISTVDSRSSTQAVWYWNLSNITHILRACQCECDCVLQWRTLTGVSIYLVSFLIWLYLTSFNLLQFDLIEQLFFSSSHLLFNFLFSSLQYHLIGMGMPCILFYSELDIACVVSMSMRECAQ